MTKKQIKVGGFYEMKVSDKLVIVRVDSINVHNPSFGGSRSIGRERTTYGCVNLATGRHCSARSASKFRREVPGHAAVSKMSYEYTDARTSEAVEVVKALEDLRQ